MAKAQRKITRKSEGTSGGGGLPVQEAEPQEESISEIWDQYKGFIWPALLALLAFMIIVNGYKWWTGRKASGVNETAREIRFAAAEGNAEQLLQVLDQYPDAPEAARQYLALGKRYFNQNQKQLALETLDKLLTDHPNFTFASEVELMKATCLEDLFRHDEAKTILEDWIAANPEHVRLPIAKFGVARCLHQMDPPQTDAAIALLDEYLASEDAKDPFKSQAETYKEWFGNDKRRALADN